MNLITTTYRSAFLLLATLTFGLSSIGLNAAPPSAGKPHNVSLPGGLVLEMVWVKPGKFKMGSPANEAGRKPVEGPLTDVTISHGYWMGKFEVTQGQYLAVVGQNRSTFKQVGDNAPVERVTWNDALSFCRRLTQQERDAGRLPDGYVYTLPTEAQWEYAARAGKSSAYSNGNGVKDLDKAAWFADNSGQKTNPVGQKAANAWGLHDMMGNVNEWCLDYLGTYPGGAVTDPKGPTGGMTKASRGGSWINPAAECRVAHRFNLMTGLQINNQGFRLVLAKE
jgi:formylglycine-generating enzyme required for sulfatase activity